MVSEQRIQTICLLTLSFVAVGVAMYWLRPVLIPFVLATFLTYGLSPLIDFQMRRWRFPRSLAVVGAAALGVVLLVLLGALVSMSVSQMTANAKDYQEGIDRTIDWVAERVPLEKIGVKEKDFTKTLFRLPGLPGLVSGTIGAVMSLLSNGLLVIIFMLFMLAGSGGGAGGGKRESPGSVWEDIRAQIQQFIVTKAFVSGLTGVLVGVTLYLLGVQLALVFGVLAFLFNFIPNIGSVISTLLPLPVVLLAPEMSPVVKILAIAIPGAIQFTVGNVIEPRIMGQSLDLSPITILLALIFFGMLWGLVGMFLATPITAVIRILFDKLDYTRPLAGLLAGRLDQIGAGPHRTGPPTA